MYTTSKSFGFAATRTLFGFPVDHPNTQSREHVFSVTFELTSVSLNKHGYIIDLDKLVSIDNLILCYLENKNLNQVFQFNPTNENMAKFFFKKFKKTFPNIHAVIIKEQFTGISSKYVLSHDEEDHIELELK
jgi:6-pyruvoyltetrahydropterin/6-carboxytetrahydropterin synthase